MKKIFNILLILPFLLTGCSSNTDSSIVVEDYTLFKEKQLNSYFDVLSQKEDKYIVYYYSEGCSYCKKVYLYLYNVLFDVQNGKTTEDYQNIYTLDFDNPLQNPPDYELYNEDGKEITTTDMYKEYILGLADINNFKRFVRPCIWFISTIDGVKTINKVLVGSGEVINYFTNI